jgi:hypothetical protein
VADGWQEIGTLCHIHVNYGWGNWATDWYAVDSLYDSNVDEEYAMIGIHPWRSLGPSFSGIYTLGTFPYRYFDEDATGDNASFAAGHYLQFLPGVTVTCNNNTIAFNSTSSASTHLFINGDTTNGIHLHNGALILRKDGSISFPRQK